jgi:hypothetical protein
MDREERELRNDRLGQSLRAALGAERAPRDWVRDALAAPHAGAAVAPRPVPAPPAEPWYRDVLPHLCGLALLVGLGLAALLRPDVFQNLAVGFGALLPALSRTRADASADVARYLPQLLLISPLILFACYEGARALATHRR